MSLLLALVLPLLLPISCAVLYSIRKEHLKLRAERVRRQRYIALSRGLGRRRR